MRATGLTGQPVGQHTIVNAILFQVAWLFCVIGGSTVAVPVTLVVLSLHLWWVSRPGRELLFLTLAAAVGMLFDNLLIRGGVLLTPDAHQPVWLFCLWPLFATTIGYPLRWFRDHPVAAMFGGGLFAPLSYYAGSHLAGIGLLQPDWLALVWIGLAWALAFPALTLLHRRIVP